MASITRYETRTLECWPKAKELRMSFYKEVARARELGKILVSGGSAVIQALPAGLGDYIFLGGEPYAASVSTDMAFQQSCSEAVEARGFAQDMCGYVRMYLGSMYRNQFFFGGEFPRPHFCLQMTVCDSQGKWFQQVSEHLGIPYFSIDYPGSRNGDDWYDRGIKYLVDQFNEAIEWMEKVTGRTYNDELLIQAVRNECMSTSLWADVCCLNKNVPAPLEHKSMFPLWVIGVMMRPRKDAVDFYSILRDEVRERVKKGIAALPVEQCRIMDDNIPPWFMLEMYRYLERYGAVAVGSHHTFFLAGSFETGPDGSLVRARTPDERGLPLRTREDALRAYAIWHMEKHFFSDQFSSEVLPKPEMFVRTVREWKCDCAIIHQNRGCEGNSQGGAEDRLALLHAGIPVLTYEGNMVDKRELNMVQIKERFDSFMENMGVRKIKD